jgi:protein transport protein SEC23
MAVPVGCLYTPLRPIPGMAVVNYPPLACKTQTCGGILNPYCRVDYMTKIWLCPFCMTRNHFPLHYAEISTESRPAEVLPTCTTMEYVVDTNVTQPPVFVFVLDTCVIEEELQSLKSTVLLSLMLLPENSLVGLVTFGKNVHVHELSFEDCPKSYVFRGTKAVTAEQVTQLLGLRTAPNAQQQGQRPPSSRFLMPVSECEFQLTTILDDLSKDCWQYKNTERALRCTGAAISIAVALMEATYKGHNSRIMVFAGGPPTVGPGMVVSNDFKESIRSHHDIQKGNATYMKDAVAFYESLAVRANANGHVIDTFACCLDQMGLAEMKVCSERTGGYIVLDDSFTRAVFTGSFKRVFLRDAASNELAMAFGGELSVLTSREYQVCGAIGFVSSMDKKSANVSDTTEIGVGNTCAWALGGLDQNSTVGLYFDVVNQNADALKDGRQAYLQIVTRYRRSNGQQVMRVSTIAKTFADPKTDQGVAYVKAGFDQEASAVLMARYAVWKTYSEFTFDILRWLDRTLIRLVNKFATYKKDDPQSFRLSNEFSYYPQFMFHLRRSQFLQVYNCSPDESSFYRSILCRENVTNSLIMMQPTIMAYSLDGPAQPVMLDVSSCSPTRILVLDTFFHVVIWYGDTISKWQADGIHLKPEYDYFAQLLNAPKNDVQGLMETRFPHPRFVECVERGSQSRFLMAKLNPSVPASTNDGSGDQLFVTEDVSLKVFMQHLRRLAVQTP